MKGIFEVDILRAQHPNYLWKISKRATKSVMILQTKNLWLLACALPISPHPHECMHRSGLFQKALKHAFCRVPGSSSYGLLSPTAALTQRFWALLEWLNWPQIFPHTPNIIAEFHYHVGNGWWEATGTAWPENVMSTILYAFETGGGKQKENSLSHWHLSQSTTWPPCRVTRYVSSSWCCSFCNMLAALHLSGTFGSGLQHGVWMGLFWKRDKAEWETGMPAALWGPITLPQLEKRNVLVMPFQLLWAIQGWRIF